MKRARVLEERVADIVNEGRAKDANGQPVYAFIQEPLILGLFGAPEALFEVLRERPLIVLNLIETNKALQAFWDRFEDVWILLIDSLVERAWPMPHSVDIYPFFAIMNQRIEELTRELFRVQTKTKHGSFLRRNHHLQSELLLPSTVIGRNLANPETAYSLIYYDPLTKILVEICQRILALNDFFTQPKGVLQKMKSWWNYTNNLGMNHFIHEYMGKIGLESLIYSYIVCLPDAFLIETTDATGIVNQGELTFDFEYLERVQAYLSERYAEYNHGPLLFDQVEITKENGAVKVGVFPKKVAESLSKVIQLISRLDYLLRNREKEAEEWLISMPKPIDASIASPYRDLMYHPTQGLYNTKEKQKILFLALLTLLSDLSSKEEVREQFGDSVVLEPFACTFCMKETYMVDPFSKCAFCDMNCWSQYKQYLDPV
jgi:hypothetical protein